MSREPENQRAKLRNELDHQIALYRARLETEGKWPEKANELLNQLVDNAPHQELTETDLEMLSLVVNDALHDVDIQKQYPAFYKRLVEEPGLRDAFLDVLEMAEEGENEELELELPEPISKKLTFLAEPDPVSIVEQLTDRWRVTWQQSTAYLNTVFLSRNLAFGYRNQVQGEDPWFVLLREQIIVEQSQLNVFLEATLQEKGPVELALALAVTINAQPARTWSKIVAFLSWGDYQESLSIRLNERTSLPPAPLQQLLNEQMNTFRSDLQLSLDLVSYPEL